MPRQHPHSIIDRIQQNFSLLKMIWGKALGNEKSKLHSQFTINNLQHSKPIVHRVRKMDRPINSIPLIHKQIESKKDLSMIQ